MKCVHSSTRAAIDHRVRRLGVKHASAHPGLKVSNFPSRRGGVNFAGNGRNANRFRRTAVIRARQQHRRHRLGSCRNGQRRDCRSRNSACYPDFSIRE